MKPSRFCTKIRIASKLEERCSDFPLKSTGTLGFRLNVIQKTCCVEWTSAQSKSVHQSSLMHWVKAVASAPCLETRMQCNLKNCPVGKHNLLSHSASSNLLYIVISLLLGRDDYSSRGRKIQNFWNTLLQLWQNLGLSSGLSFLTIAYICHSFFKLPNTKGLLWMKFIQRILQQYQLFCFRTLWIPPFFQLCFVW